MSRRLPLLIMTFIIAFTLGIGGSRYVSASDWFYANKEFALDPISRQLSSLFLKMFSNNVIKAISGLGTEQGKNSPVFVLNWKQFLGEASDIGLNQFRSQLKYSINNNLVCDNLKDPLNQVFNSTNAADAPIGNLSRELLQGSLNLFQSNVKCSVPKVVVDEFNKDFKKGGGWETWVRLLEPQNNLAGTLALSLEEMSKQQGAQANARQSETVAGQGFTGAKGACRGSGKTAECDFLGKTLTPAKVFGEGAAQWLDQKGQWFVGSDEIFEVITAIIGGALGKLTNFADQATGLDISGATKKLTDDFDKETDSLKKQQDANDAAAGSNLEGTRQQSQGEVQRQLCVAQCEQKKSTFKTPDESFACTAACP